MNNALYVAATGMRAQQMHVETVANNLTNSVTPGYKRSRVSFDDLMYRQSAQNTIDQARPTSAYGSGVMINFVSKSFAPGDIRKTDQPLDIAIQGEGLVEVVMPDGSTAFTRGGTLKVGADGILSTSQGHPLKGGIQIPTGAMDITVAADGTVTARTEAKGEPVELGHLEINQFVNVEGLEPIGEALYRATALSGEAQPGKPGEDGAGTFAQGFIEVSNVNLADEMVNLMMAQRAYSMSVKVAQAADEIMSMVNNLRKG